MALAHGGVLEAQDAGTPTFQAQSRGDVVLLQVAVPKGWSLYAPVLADQDAPGSPTGAGSSGGTPPPVGRPLRILSDGEVVIPSTWPDAVVRSTVLGVARVHEPGVYLGRIVLAPSAPDEIEVEWALCSDTLCIPGRTRVTF